MCKISVKYLSSFVPFGDALVFFEKTCAKCDFVASGMSMLDFATVKFFWATKYGTENQTEFDLVGCSYINVKFEWFKSQLLCWVGRISDITWRNVWLNVYTSSINLHRPHTGRHSVERRRYIDLFCTWRPRHLCHVFLHCQLQRSVAYFVLKTSFAN